MKGVFKLITVTYSPKKHQLRIKGHAEYAPKGQDIVCAAATMIFYNLCQMFREYDEGKAFCKPPKMQFTSGRACVEVVPRTGYENWIEHDFLFALTGYRLLMAKFPDRVNLKINQN